MKDIQVDATSFPGKAFDMTFEMPEEEVGIFTFNKCVSVDQWEAMGRPDIAEKASHTSCPAAIIETAKMYNPNMKVEILAIPPASVKTMCAASGGCLSEMKPTPTTFDPSRTAATKGLGQEPLGVEPMAGRSRLTNRSSCDRSVSSSSAVTRGCITVPLMAAVSMAVETRAW